MLRAVVAFTVLAAAIAAPQTGRGDTEFCAGETECPADCGFVSRNEKCIFCQCGPGPLEPGEVVVGIESPCPPGTVPGSFQAFTKTCKPAPAGSGCKFGPAYIDECNNDCSCVDNKFYGCTKKPCKPGERPEAPMPCKGGENLPKRSGMRVFCHEGIIKVQRHDAKCLPGAQFLDKDNCNTCTCSDNGMVACTEKLCGVDKVGPKAGCPHGQGFIDECDNDCHCVDGDFYGCTFKACLPGQTSQEPMECKGAQDLPKRSDGVRVFCHEGIVKVQDKKEACLPGAVFMDDCNTCSCGDNGAAGCTLRFCIPEEEKGTCKYGPGFIDECNNDCTCVDNKSYGCTRKACKPGQSPEEPLKCKGTDNLPERSGKRVVCHEGIVKLQDKTDSCLPGSAYKEECNDCSCSDTGLPLCTLKACLPDVKENKCTFGPQYIDECTNDCNCIDNSFYACTRKACKPGQTAKAPLACKGADDLPTRANMRVFCHEGVVKVQPKDENCLPGAVYKDECNTCTCSDTGVAGCTLKACGVNIGSKCEHGPEFIDECNNDCRCIDNTFYGCTRKACRSGQTAEKPMSCSGVKGLPERKERRVICHDGIVKLQGPKDECLPGSVYRPDSCNTCTCSSTGVAGCTLIGCL